MGTSGRATAGTGAENRVADSVLAASRVLVSVAARSIAAAGQEITLPQYRALVVIASRGPQRPVGLAEALGISSSTTTRLCDRLERKGLLLRERDYSATDRRAVLLRLAPAGTKLVADVTRRRRADIAAVLAEMAPRDRSRLVAGFEAFTRAAGEVPDAAWPTGSEL
ncbi:MAG: MarR family winged helix-turn-helix transcriptional regulator [Acidimicrobiales bacterium]